MQAVDPAAAYSALLGGLTSHSNNKGYSKSMTKACLKPPAAIASSAGVLLPSSNSRPPALLKAALTCPIAEILLALHSELLLGDIGASGEESQSKERGKHHEAAHHSASKENGHCAEQNGVKPPNGVPKHDDMSPAPLRAHDAEPSQKPPVDYAAHHFERYQ